MSVDLQPLSNELARKAVLRALGISQPIGTGIPGPELCAEALRAALWAEWAASAQPVYVTRLVNAAARILLPWREIEDCDAQRVDELLWSALQDLEIIGDVAALPRGRWAPTPPRVVHVPAVGRWLLLGGPPTRSLPAPARDTLELVGVARLLCSDPLDLGLGADMLPEQEWLRVPEESLEAWGRSVLEDSPLAPAGELEVELYVPTVAAPGSNQFSRWIRPDDRLADGRYLARTRTRRGARACYIAQLRRGHVIAAGPPLLGDGDVRRLQYALDLLANNPVRIFVDCYADTWTFTLRSALPRAEQRLFLTIGRERTPDDGTFYPRYWCVSSSYAPRACAALRSLGITIKVSRKTQRVHL